MEYLALYRKYRPLTFEDVVGQEATVAILRQALKQGKIAHAYLFAGPKGTGKTTVARIFAKGLNCVNGPTDKPCMQCDSCLSITNGTNIDVLEIDAASNRGIDEIRDLKDKVQYVSVSARYKVYIIDEAHMLTNQAFNALLKTLEEPPKNVVFILATTEAEKIPQTIISRCERFYFKPISIQDLVERINLVCNSEGVKITDGAARIIARLASSSLRNALSLLDQAMTMYGSEINEENLEILFDTPEDRAFYDFVNAFIAKDQPSILKDIGSLEDNGKDAKVFLSGLLDYLQDLITARITGFDDIKNKRDSELVELMKEQSKRVSPKKLIELSSVLVDLLPKLRNFKEPYFPILLASLNFITDESSFAIPAAQVEVQTASDTKPKTIKAEASEASLPAETKVSEVSGELTIEKISSNWDKVLAAVKPKSVVLFPMVAKSTPVEYKDKCVTLIPEKKFYVSMLRQENNLHIIEEALQQVFGTQISVSISEPMDEKLFNREEAMKEVIEKPVVKEVLKLFDGSVTDVNKIEEDK
ncbi:MAG: DNA polymerase III subunit gamma/tau [Caldisericaceae bacterium]